MTTNLPKRMLAGAEVTAGGLLLTCDCGTAMLVEFHGLEQADGSTREVAVTCDGCQTTHWLTLNPVTGQAGSRS